MINSYYFPGNKIGHPYFLLFSAAAAFKLKIGFQLDYRIELTKVATD